MYINLGSWTDQSGTFIPEEIRRELDEELPLGKVTFTGIILTGTVTKGSAVSNIYYPSHSCDKRHVMNFIKFLRDCGGFTIW